MAEKRRATTFRTSKGTIVNVQYPDIYVSPAFLSTEDVTNPTEMRAAIYHPVYNLGEIIFVDTCEVNRAIYDPKYGATGNAMLCNNPWFVPGHPFQGGHFLRLDPGVGTRLGVYYPRFGLEHGRGKYGFEFEFAQREGLDTDSFRYIDWAFGSIYDAETQKGYRAAEVRLDLVKHKLVWVDRNGYEKDFTEPESKNIIPAVTYRKMHAGLVMDFADMTYVRAYFNQWKFDSFAGQPIREKISEPPYPLGGERVPVGLPMEWTLKIAMANNSDVNAIEMLVGGVIVSKVS